MFINIIKLSRLQFGMTAFISVSCPSRSDCQCSWRIMENITSHPGAHTVWRDVTKILSPSCVVDFAVGVTAAGSLPLIQLARTRRPAPLCRRCFRRAAGRCRSLMAFSSRPRPLACSSWLGAAVTGAAYSSHLPHASLRSKPVGLCDSSSPMAESGVHQAAPSISSPCAWRSRIFVRRTCQRTPVARAKFVHTISADYVVGSMSCCRAAPLLSAHPPPSQLTIRSMSSSSQLRPCLGAVGGRARR